MNDDLVKAWRDPYFREVEAPAAAVMPHPSGELHRAALEDTVGGTGDGTFFCWSGWGTCPDDTYQAFCVTLQSGDVRCCCV